MESPEIVLRRISRGTVDRSSLVYCTPPSPPFDAPEQLVAWFGVFVVYLNQYAMSGSFCYTRTLLQ